MVGSEENLVGQNDQDSLGATSEVLSTIGSFDNPRPTEPHRAYGFYKGSNAEFELSNQEDWFVL